MTYSGQCSCGAVSITLDAEPIGVRQCWCRQCQQIAAGGPTNNAMFPTEAMTVTGDPAQHGYTAASGNTLTHEFCAACGTQLFAHSSARPHLRTVRLGVLEEGHDLKPEMAIWVDDAPVWAVIDPTLERFPQQPPAPPKS